MIIYHCETGYELEVSEQIVWLALICFSNILRNIFSVMPFCFTDLGPKRLFYTLLPYILAVSEKYLKWLTILKSKVSLKESKPWKKEELCIPGTRL